MATTDTTEAVQQLRQALGTQRVSTAEEDLSVYAFDGTAVLHQLPACVVLPETVEEVVQILRVANETATP
ncbi:MAG: glycolate oxidase subunit GlcD, partial [Gemmatimonadetes bacterium]|nr:glycolate oxidase subunit GlcD [Gemmatimonadota bacterium]